VQPDAEKTPAPPGAGFGNCAQLSSLVNGLAQSGQLRRLNVQNYKLGRRQWRTVRVIAPGLVVVGLIRRQFTAVMLRHAATSPAHPEITMVLAVVPDTQHRPRFQRPVSEIKPLANAPSRLKDLHRFRKVDEKRCHCKPAPCNRCARIWALLLCWVRITRVRLPAQRLSAARSKKTCGQSLKQANGVLPPGNNATLAPRHASRWRRIQRNCFCQFPASRRCAAWYQNSH